jgi:hypothetical protein
MSVVKEVVVVTGKYTDKDGKEKNRYLTIGKIINTAKGEMLKLDCLPVGVPEFNGWCYLNEPRDNSQGQGQGRQQQSKSNSQDGFEDDIPF